MLFLRCVNLDIEWLSTQQDDGSLHFRKTLTKASMWSQQVSLSRKSTYRESERGITILFVEQNVRRSLEEADRAYILEVGRVTLSGTAEDLREEETVKKAYFGV